MTTKLLAGLLALFLTGCAGKTVKIEPKLFPRGPEVIITFDSDPVPEELKQHIIKRTDGFCKEAGRPGVQRIVIEHHAQEQNTRVVYLCHDECSSIDDPPDCKPGQKKVTEEVMPKKKEIHYYTFLAFILGY